MDFGAACDLTTSREWILVASVMWGPGYKDRTTWLGMRAVHLVMDAD